MQTDVSEPDRRRSKISNDEDDPTKARKRVSRACNRCRNKKDKCDGLRPSCSTCMSTNQLCSYEAITKKRGLPEGYVRGLEKLWAVSISKIEGLEEAVGEITAQHQQELLQIWNHDVIGEDLHIIWKESKILHDLESLLSGLERDATPILKRKRGREEEEEETSPDDTEPSFHRQVQYRITNLSDEAKSSSKRRRLSERVSEPQLNVSLPGSASKLLDHYFAYTHCWFPILDRPQILRTCYKHSRKQRADYEPSADLAVLWAIFAYSAPQVRNSKATDSGREKIGQETTANEMRAIARGFIPDERGEFAIGHVQALLLLTLFDVGLGDWTSAWLLVGFAVRIALELDLGHGSAEKHGVSVLHGCFMLDTLIASHLSRPPHLRRSDMSNVGYSEEDGHEEWEPWSTPRVDISGQREPAFIISCFNRLVDVFLIFNDVITCDLQPGDARNAYFGDRSQILKALQNIYPFPMTSTTPSPPHQIHLRLFHLSVSILVRKQSSEGDIERDSTLARLACDVLKLITEYGGNSALGLHRIASILENPVRSACYAALASKSSFSSLSGVPSYHAFAKKMTENILEISSMWPVFSSLSNLWQRELQSESPSNEILPTNINIAHGKGDWRNGFPFLQPQTFSESALSADWGATHQSGVGEHTRTSLEPSRPSVQVDDFRLWSPPETGQMPFTMTSINSGINDRASVTAGSSAMADLDHDWRDVVIDGGLDMAMSGMEQSSPASLVMPGTERSHSLHGDEVDAIFHNLAHLDTTEWTNKRAQGLKEFGFADDTTFQAFCNDPERFVTAGTPFAQSSHESTDFWRSSWSLPGPSRRDGGYPNLG